MKLYQAKRYPEAIEQFKAAIAAETGQPSTKDEVAQTRALALAHFNLACAMALARKAGKTCEVGAYLGVVWEHVLESIRLDPSRLEKAVSDPDLKELRRGRSGATRGASPKGCRSARSERRLHSS